MVRHQSGSNRSDSGDASYDEGEAAFTNPRHQADTPPSIHAKHPYVPGGLPTPKAYDLRAMNLFQFVNKYPDERANLAQSSAQYSLEPAVEVAPKDLDVSSVGLHTRIGNALYEYGVETLGQLVVELKVDIKFVTSLDNCGEKSHEQVIKVLTDRGLWPPDGDAQDVS